MIGGQAQAVCNFKKVTHACMYKLSLANKKIVLMCNMRTA